MTKGGSGIQIDKGDFVRIHHDILALLATAPLTGGELRCLLFLFRKTYGYNKKEDKISLAQWSEGTGMKRQNVWSLLQTLLERNIIYAKSTGQKRAVTWGFNKYHEQWNLESVMPQHDKSVMLDHDSSVMPQHDSSKKSVMPQHDKSVIPPHERTKDIKTTTTTTTEGGDSGSFSDPESSILQSWRDNMDAPLTPILITDLKECIATYGPKEVLAAIGIAVGADNRTLRYVKGVLNRRRPLANGINGTSGYANMVLVRVEDSDE